jgi:cell division protein FtsZ
MIPYNRDPRQVIPSSSVKIIGLGGAGANMLERIALDGMEGAELLALNTDVRTLGSCLAKEKIQLGVNLTKGLGAGGDPELGHSAVLEAEDLIRAAVKGRRIVFLCTGLGGGTGSGAAPIVTRIAREEGAFVVVFATMPFAFEGKRRRDQAETSLNELAVLSNALVTFDNNRMGELVLAKQGIHEAFIAADHMICESIKAVIRLVIRPGLINVGLDDLMSALRTNRSRCLFGSGMANGKDRATKALRNALASPLLDQGSLLKEAQTVLVHLSGGEDLTLFEIELLMQRLQKFVPEQAHVLFGAAIDPALGDSLSLTLISALPEDSLAMAPRESLSQASKESPLLDPSQGFTPPTAKRPAVSAPAPLPDFVDSPAPEAEFEPEPEPEPEPALEPVVAAAPEPKPEPEPEPEPAPARQAAPKPEPVVAKSPAAAKPEPQSNSLISKFRRTLVGSAAASATPTLFDDDRPFAEPEVPARGKAQPAAAPAPAPEPAPAPAEKIPVLDLPEDDETIFEGLEEEEEATHAAVVAEFIAVSQPDAESDKSTGEPAGETELTENEVSTYLPADPDPEPIEDEEEDPNAPNLASSGFTPIPKKRPPGVSPWSVARGIQNPATEAERTGTAASTAADTPASAPTEPETPKLKLGIKPATPQSELSLDSAPRGRFEGENPNVFDGEDLDLPPFLRKKK